MRYLRRAAAAALIAGLALSTGATLPAEEKDEKKVDLQLGDEAPVFTANDDQGKEWKFKDHLGKKYLAVFFFPAALTGG